MRRRARHIERQTQKESERQSETKRGQRYIHSEGVTKRKRERERDKERGRERQRKSESDRDREKYIKRDTHRQTKTEIVVSLLQDLFLLFTLIIFSAISIEQVDFCHFDFFQRPHKVKEKFHSNFRSSLFSSTTTMSSTISQS